jgi:hypothetical protein
MICKTVEIRDAATFIPALAVKLEPGCPMDSYLLARAGYGSTPWQQGEYVLLLRLEDAPYDPFGHAGGGRTMCAAHEHLLAHFDEIESGAVVDVEFLRGETPAPKPSERATGLVEP